MQAIAQRHGLSMLQLACQWNLCQPPVKSVVPALIQEAHAEAKSIDAKLHELATLPAANLLTAAEIDEIRRIDPWISARAMAFRRGARQRRMLG